MEGSLMLPLNMANAISKVKSNINILPDSVDEIRLFGSCANNHYTAASDFDILILSKHLITDRVERAKIREKFDELLQEFGIECDVVFYTKDTYNNDNSLFTQELHKSFLIYKKKEDENGH